jgi:type IV pilus assembly protein PilO
LVSGIAALPSIVTLHTITLSPGSEGGLMTMEATAKTYHYLGNGE